MIYPFDMRVVFTEDGVMIDGEPLTEHPNLRFYGDTEHDGKANLRSGNLKPNEDKPMGYRVTTDKFEGIPKGTIVEPSMNVQGIAYLPGDNRWYANQHYIDAHEEYFEPVEQVQEGQYFSHDNCTYRVSETGIGNISQLPVRAEVVSGYLKNHSDFFSEEYVRNNELSTDEIKEALTEEFERRYGGHVPCHIDYFDNGKDILRAVESCTYHERTDTLTVHSARGFHECEIYKQGQWAEVLDQTPTIEINGYEVDLTQHVFVKVGCTDISKSVFRNLTNYSESYNIRIYREGEDITDQIKQIAEYYQTNKGG